MIMDIVNVGPVGHCDRNASNEQKALYAEILTLRAKVEGEQLVSNMQSVLIDDLKIRNSKLLEALREITYSHDGYARKKAEQALATYDKLSEDKHDTK